MVCVNLMNLLLARASAREQEIAVRVAIGGSRRGVMLQLLIENLVRDLAAADETDVRSYARLWGRGDRQGLGNLFRAYSHRKTVIGSTRLARTDGT